MLGYKIAIFELGLFTKGVERSLGQDATIHTIK